ncbi:SRPBCC family protein [Asticcacaulis sp. AC402]|uniref:SRPBCC family protein n=1 Tax=Asticcacaulis sp. AC402 TaxID=1282361 RepID=UPI0003C3B9C7|nr:SRPBCC family protein [Asticcacaulis sp. AC402]ESQ76762.1 polyketide cyclase [Asticcacaulis sp. AC402]
MKPIKLALMVCGIGVAAIAATFLLPHQVTVERRSTVKAQPEEIVAMLASEQGYQRINPYRTRDPNLKTQPFGPTSGVGSGFHFAGKDGEGSQTVTRVTKNSVTYAIDLGDLGQPRQAVSVMPVAGGSEVVWQMTMDLGMNPVMRVMGVFMDAMLGETLETGLSNLSRVSGQA